MDLAVKAKFDSYPQHIRNKLFELRALILDVANNDAQIGMLDETLKWGELSYLTNETKSGTTVRMDWKEKYPNEIGLFVNCKTTLLDQFRSLFPHTFRFEGERAVWIQHDKPLPEFELRAYIKMALRYHLDKK